MTRAKTGPHPMTIDRMPAWARRLRRQHHPEWEFCDAGLPVGGVCGLPKPCRAHETLKSGMTDRLSTFETIAEAGRAAFTSHKCEWDGEPLVCAHGLMLTTPRPRLDTRSRTRLTGFAFGLSHWSGTETAEWLAADWKSETYVIRRQLAARLGRPSEGGVLFVPITAWHLATADGVERKQVSKTFARNVRRGLARRKAVAQ